jgi:hypothetical protein
MLLKLKPYLPYVAVLISVLGLLGRGKQMYDAHVIADQQHIRLDEARDERIRVLQHIIGSELPQYTLAIWPPKE